MLKTAANVVQHSSCLSTFHLTAGDIAVALTGVLPQADILALGGQSKILGRCWDVLKVVTCLQSSLWPSPTQGNTVLKNWFHNERLEM